MSFRAYFTFAAGLSSTLKVPIGTLESINHHVDWVESALNIEREQYLDNPSHWKWNKYEFVTDKELCKIAEKHNEWVRDLYDDFAKWSTTPPTAFEEITNDDFQKFLPALQFVEVKPERWTGDYYTKRMQSLYQVMRGEESEGVLFGEKKLTPKQAAAVIRIFSPFLDKENRDLDVPNGHDYLASSYDGGYYWCEKCGAATYDDAEMCKKRKCPYQEDFPNEEY